VELDPIHQFQIYPIIPLKIGNLDLSFTNASLFMVVTLLLASGFLIYAARNRGLVPSRLQSVAEISYEFIAGMLRQTTGHDGMKFFPLVFSLFMFILVANLVAMWPYYFAVTSQVIVTATMALTVFFTVIIYGIRKHGLGFFRIFLPSGIPGWIAPVIVPIEIFSFLSRPLSHSLRLFANILAGHITLKVFAGFVVMLGSFGFLGILGAAVPFVMTVALTALEFLVAFLQAYVFAFLTCIYLNDAVHGGHGH
jgi:F-type H+-transporting ATPase subunit a